MVFCTPPLPTAQPCPLPWLKPCRQQGKEVPPQPPTPLPPTCAKSCVFVFLLLLPKPCRQQGKEVTEDLKVFSRTIPFQYLGRETDVRVFIARTLNPGEAPPLTVAMATEVLLKKQAAAAKAAAGVSAFGKVMFRVKG